MGKYRLKLFIVIAQDLKELTYFSVAVAKAKYHCQIFRDYARLKSSALSEIENRSSSKGCR